MDSDRLRQSSFQGRQRETHTPLQVESSGPPPPRELAPDPCKLPHQLWGRSSCRNPVPQERHLLVIGTMEMAGLVLDLALGSELPRRQKGDGWSGVGEGRRVVCSATSVFLRL